MLQGDPRSARKRLQDVGYGGRISWGANSLPGMHKLPWTVNLEKLPLEGIRFTSGDAGSLPLATRTHVARPLSRVHHTGTDPPLTNFFRGKRLEDKLWGYGNLYSGLDCSFREVSNCSYFAVSEAIHFDPQEGHSKRKNCGMQSQLPPRRTRD
jgi:hypothetical protein